MEMKTSEIEDKGVLTFDNSKFVNVRGDEMMVKTAENGFMVRAEEVTKDKDGDRVTKFREYVFTDIGEFIQSVRFWAEKQRAGK